MPFRSRLVAGLLLALALLPARAHDTWFQPRLASSPPVLWLGTGDRFPVLEYRLEFEHLSVQGCAPQAELAGRGAAAGTPMRAASGPAARVANALVLRAPGGEGPQTCWASQVPFDIEIEPAKVELYLKEIAAGPTLRAAWAAELAAGRPWRERFGKHARIELGSTASPVPVGLKFEALLLTATPKVGEDSQFQLLESGQPLAGQPVELVNEQSRFGLWRRTDTQGRIVLPLPLAGRWLLRSTLLRPPASAGERWTSEFVTLAFELPAPVAR
jgi:Domain of unknown function (DUF4198)